MENRDGFVVLLHRERKRERDTYDKQATMHKYYESFHNEG